MTYLNGCSDAYTQVDQAYYSQVIADIESKMKIITPIGASIIGLGFATWIVTAIAVGLTWKRRTDEVASFAEN
jgi:hypothetical protein